MASKTVALSANTFQAVVLSVNAFEFRSVLLDPTHVAGTLADDFIVTLVTLEFDHDVIASVAVLGEDVHPAQRIALDLPIQVLKLPGPR